LIKKKCKIDQCYKYLLFYFTGKLKPHLKSQGIPKRNAGPVKIVVGKSFEKVVLDKNKDVLIELYAPWCGHCKTLEPIYNELAKKLKKEKNLVIAKLDATANEILDPYMSSGFPTIYFAPSNKKSEPIKFEGDRTLEELEKFVKEHSTVAFKAKDEL
jgi:protein disulfide-isomerase A4